MKIAVFHQFLDNIGGAELVTFHLARELNADVYTTNIDPEKIKKMGFSDLLPRIKSIGSTPINAPFRQQLSLIRFRLLNLKNKYDFFIISGDWAISASVNNKPCLYYIHSPPRELFDLKSYIKKKLVPFWACPIFDIWASYNAYLYKMYIKHPSYPISNSKNTQSRLLKYLNFKTSVINPPVSTALYSFKKHKNYWLSVNRLFPHKRIELQMKAFAKLPNENLIIIGSYEQGSRQFEKYKKYLESIKPKNVKIISWISDPELRNLYSQCKGLICTAQDEDFGLSPIEAMASGKPVIAANEGGYRETIIPETGILIDSISVEKLANAIKKINSQLRKNPNFYVKACQKQAEKYDISSFIKQIKSPPPYSTHIIKKGSLKFKVRHRKKRPKVDEKIIDDIFSKAYTKHFSLPKNPTIIDIGAHIGSFSLLMSHLYPKSKIYAYEPHPENFSLLKENILLNKKTNIAPFQLSISDSSTPKILYTGKNNACHSFYEKSLSSNKVKSTTLEKVTSSIKGNIDLLKVDCEGAEYPIILNSPESAFLKIKKIVLEYHERFSPNNKNQLIKHLSKLGYSTKLEKTNLKRGIIYASKSKFK